MKRLSKAAPTRETGRTRDVSRELVNLLAPCVERAFCVAGAANMPFIAAWAERQLPLTVCLEEKRGLHMAEGFARTAGRLALMTTTAGPGAAALASALALALRERTPLIAVCGQTPQAFAHREPVQELDIRGLLREVTLATWELASPNQLGAVVSHLVKTATNSQRKGPVLLSVPADLWQLPCVPQRPIQFPEPWSAVVASNCSAALASSERLLIIAGSGITQAGVSEDLRTLVDLLPEVRVAVTPRALGAFPASHQKYVGPIGFGGFADATVEPPDRLLVLGTRLHEMSTNFAPFFQNRPVIHLDIDPNVPGKVFPATGYVADLAVALPDLCRQLRLLNGYRRLPRPAPANTDPPNKRKVGTR
jgi:acetolactate synthase-1/2/3 large subunit